MACTEVAEVSRTCSSGSYLKDRALVESDGGCGSVNIAFKGGSGASIAS